MAIDNIKSIRIVVGTGIVLVLLSVVSIFAFDAKDSVENNYSFSVIVVAIGFVGGILMFLGLGYYWVKFVEALGKKDNYTQSNNPWD